MIKREGIAFYVIGVAFFVFIEEFVVFRSRIDVIGYVQGHTAANKEGLSAVLEFGEGQLFRANLVKRLASNDWINLIQRRSIAMLTVHYNVTSEERVVRLLNGNFLETKGLDTVTVYLELREYFLRVQIQNYAFKGKEYSLYGSLRSQQIRHTHSYTREACDHTIMRVLVKGFEAARERHIFRAARCTDCRRVFCASIIFVHHVRTVQRASRT